MSKKSLVSAIVLSTGILFGGCSSKICYDLPNEEIFCMYDDKSATITKPDKTIVKIDYSGTEDDPSINYVEITKDKVTKRHKQIEILEEAKKQLVNYIKTVQKSEVEKVLKELQ